ncbi:MAG: hypothetical protein NT046_05430 [Arenimonas sp.]|nr:hypothetical protein [Arenimonas sp.]
MLPALLVLASLGVMAVPDPDKVPLVPADGWIVSDGFVWAGGDERELPTSLHRHPQSRFFTSWTPEGRLQGRLQTVPFVLPGSGFGVPLRGFPGEKGITILVTCVGTGASLPFAQARTNDDWVIAHFRPGADWCAGDRRVQLSAEVRSADHELFIGPPFEITPGYRLKSSALGAAAPLVIAWAVMAGLFWACFTGLAGVADARVRLGLSLSAIGLLGYAAFFVYWASMAAGATLTLAVFAVGGWGFVRFVREAAAPAPACALRQSVLSAGWLWLMVALAVVAIFSLAEVNAGSWSPNARFTPVRWSSDNQLPMVLGQMLASDHMQTGPWQGPWRISDRPPLAYGWHAIFAKVFGSRLVTADGVYLLHQHAWPVGVLLNTLWAPALFLAALRWSRSAAVSLAMVLACVLSPFLLFNSGYIWPKLLAAAFGFTAAYLLFDAGAPVRRPLRQDGAAFVLAAGLSGLALQSHGGAVFGVLAMIVVAVALRGLPSVRAMAGAVALGLAVLLPWMLYQRYIDPPGNALLKFAFAGTFGFGEEGMGVFDTIVRAYSGFTPLSWLQAKGAALQVLLGASSQCGPGEHAAVTTTLGGWRSRDFLYVLPSLLVLVVGALVARLLPRNRGASAPSAAPWLAWGVLSALLGALLTLDCHINHHQSYQSMLALHLGLLMVIARHARFFVAWVAVVAAYGLWVWVLDPLRHFAQWDATALVVGALALCVLPAVLRLLLPMPARQT